jgi:glycosyltransferase involved in cell wall biosynthesis
MKAPLVSIVIPVYNGSNYLSEAIESILKQTYRNIEIIVVNDGSQDDGATRRAALRFGDRIRYFEKENGGVSSALNRGIREMRGEFFVWLSHDDFVSPRRVETDMETLSRGRAFVSFCRWRHVDELGNELVDIEEIDYPTIVRSPRQALELGSIDFCSITAHRACFKQVGLFNEGNSTMQDVEMVMRLAREYDMVFNPGGLTYRRIHTESGTVMNASQHRIDELRIGAFLKNHFSAETFSRDWPAWENAGRRLAAYTRALKRFHQEEYAWAVRWGMLIRLMVLMFRGSIRASLVVEVVTQILSPWKRRITGLFR